jgi:Protein of unknown function with PCYCGC motif
MADPNRSYEKRRSRPVIIAVVASLFWLALVLLPSCSQVKTITPTGRHKPPAPVGQATPAPQSSERAMKDTAWDPDWPPLPGAGRPAKPIEEARAMYAFAARHPEVLQYAPCYCGCESGGHESVRDCFIKGRDANGRPQWDGMGFT